MAQDFKIDYDLATVGINSLADLFDSGGTLTIYDDNSVGIPTNADDALGAQVALVAITTPTPSFGAGSNGAAAKAGTWSGTCIASGTPTFFRLVVGAYCFQGTAGLPTVSPAVDYDLEFDNATWLLGGTVTVSTFTITLPRE